MKGKDFMAIIALVAMLVIMINPAQAALVVNKVTDEFSLASQYPTDDLKICQCGARTDVLEIKNTGDFTATFKVDITAPALQDKISVSESTFTLAPCQQKMVYVHIEAPCDAPIETYYIASVGTDYGRSKEIYKEISTKHCQNIKFDTAVLNQGKIFPGDSVAVQFNVENVGEFKDSYRIIPQGICAEFASPATEELTLLSDEKGKSVMNFKFPLKYYGQIICPFIIESQKNGEQAFGEERFTIEQDYDFSIKTDDLVINACEDVETKATVTVENLAKTPNIYYLNLQAPGFVTLSDSKIDLAAGEKDTVTMTIKPTQADVREYNLLVSAGSEYGDMEKSRQFTLKVNDCFAFDAKLDKSDLITDAQCTGEKTYNLNIRNDGLYEEAYQITVDGPGWVAVNKEDEFVRLRPAQNKDVTVYARFPDMDAKAKAFIIIKQLKAPFQEKEIELDLESMSERSCYNVELLQDSYRINYETPSIPVLVQNTGLKGGVYALKLGDLDTKFVELEEKEIALEAGETQVLHLYPKDYQNYQEGRYLNKLSLTISLLAKDETCKDIKSCPDYNKDINYERQFWVVLKDKSFLAKAWDYVRNFNYSRIGFCGVITLILLILCGGLFIGAVYMKLKGDFKIKRIRASNIKKLRIFNIAVILLMLATLLVLFLIGNPDMTKYYESKPIEADGKVYHAWQENSAYTVDLGAYFEDPDMDTLEYTASQPDHIQVTIEGTKVTLRPEYNWAGKESIVFTANDKNGGVTDSPVMTLHVLKMDPVGFMGFWNLYCKHINLVLLIVLFALVLLISDIVEEKGYNYYSSNKNQPAKRR